MTARSLFGRCMWAILLASMLLAAGSATAQERDLSGIWTFQNVQNSIRMDLRSDGTFEWNSVIQGQQQYFNGTWSAANGYLRFMPVQTNVPEAYPFVWTGSNSVTITFNGNPVPMQRPGGPPVSSPNTTQGKQTSQVKGSLTGRWVFRAQGTEMVFLLMPDKRFDLNIDQNGQVQHYTGSYNLADGQLHLRTDGVPGEEVYPLTFNSADSWTGVFEGTPVTFNREGNLPVVAPVADNKPREATPVQTRTREEPQPENTPADNPVPEAESRPQERPSAFQGLRPRRPGDAVGNTASTRNQPTGGFLSGGGPAVDLTGVWVSSGGAEQITMELFANGRFSYEAVSGGATNKLGGTYAVEGNLLAFTTSEGQLFKLPFEMQSIDTFTINADGARYTMQRREAGQRNN